MDGNQAIVGRPTFYARFDGRQAAEPIIQRLESVGYPREDVTVLLRPKGTDAVVDLTTGEPAAGQSGDARKMDDAGSHTIVLLHPSEEQVAAVRQALEALGAGDIQYEPRTVYTGRQSAADVYSEHDELVATLKAEVGAAETGQAGTEQDPAVVVEDSPGDERLRERIDHVQEQLQDIEEDLDTRKS